LLPPPIQTTNNNFCSKNRVEPAQPDFFECVKIAPKISQIILATFGLNQLNPFFFRVEKKWKTRFFWLF